MSYANYSEIEGRIAGNLPFRGSSASATIEDGVYKVYSYNTLMYSESEDGETYYNDKHYSSTTSRLQNIIKRVKGIK